MPNPSAAFAFEQLRKKIARGWRGESDRIAPVRAKQFLAKARQRRAVVHVVPRRQEMDREIDFARGGDGLFQHALGAPIDPREQTSMRFFEADQIIAAVVGRSENDRVVGTRW